ncbi:hypothetical protein C8R43DRAFT_555315 [Mycena crocata]|nr:hypothetical protein C8R43DRAFT_555315 [Mycena crocata]
MDFPDTSMSETRKRIETLDLQISALETALRDCKAERRSLKTYLNGYIYPVLTLPNELVSEIFVQSLSPASARLSEAGRDSPLFLGHICHTWRQIAISTPSLWTQIVLAASPTAAESHLNLLDIWLTRSRDCPISLAIVDVGNAPFSMHRFVEAILPHCMRWKELMLFIPGDDLQRVTGEFPLLHTLSVGQTDLAGTMDTPCPVKMYYDSPKLEKLVIHTAVRLADFSFRWENMTSIVLRAVFASSELADVLRAAVNVTVLTLQLVSSPDEEAITTFPSIPPLLHLRTLELCHPLQGDPLFTPEMQLIDKFTLPALRLLRISEQYGQHSPVQPICDLLSRSSCPLKLLRVEIRRATMSESYYRGHLPTVGEIVLDYAIPDSDDEEESEDESEDAVNEATISDDSGGESEDSEEEESDRDDSE